MEEGLKSLYTNKQLLGISAEMKLGKDTFVEHGVNVTQIVEKEEDDEEDTGLILYVPPEKNYGFDGENERIVSDDDKIVLGRNAMDINRKIRGVDGNETDMFTELSNFEEGETEDNHEDLYDTVVHFGIYAQVNGWIGIKEAESTQSNTTLLGRSEYNSNDVNPPN